MVRTEAAFVVVLLVGLAGCGGGEGDASRDVAAWRAQVPLADEATLVRIDK